MSVTGIALILFLTFHASMNVVALFSREGYNMICEFLGANWYAVVATMGLAALVALHFIYAIWLTVQNRKARGNNRYAVTDKPAKVEWASQNMLVLGIIVILGMALHLYNFWYNMMYAELAGIDGPVSSTDGVEFIVRTFSNPCFTAAYVVWLAALWFHLNHGFWSALQTLGWNGKVWFCRWRVIGGVYSTLVILMFAAVAVAFACGLRPSDYKAACAGAAQTEVPCCGQGTCPKAACNPEECTGKCQGKCGVCPEGECCKNAEKCADCPNKCAGETPCGDCAQ